MRYFKRLITKWITPEKDKKYLGINENRGYIVSHKGENETASEANWFRTKKEINYFLSNKVAKDDHKDWVFYKKI